MLRRRSSSTRTTSLRRFMKGHKMHIGSTRATSLISRIYRWKPQNRNCLKTIKLISQPQASLRLHLSEDPPATRRQPPNNRFCTTARPPLPLVCGGQAQHRHKLLYPRSLAFFVGKEDNNQCSLFFPFVRYCRRTPSSSPAYRRKV